MDSQKERSNQQYPQHKNQQERNVSQQNKDSPDGSYPETPGQENSNDNEKEDQKNSLLESQVKRIRSQQNNDSYHETPGQENSNNNEKENSRKQQLMQNNSPERRFEDDQTPNENNSQISNFIPVNRDYKQLQEQEQFHDLFRSGLLQKLLLKLKVNQKYESFQFIGSGTFSMVYSARKIKNNQNIALRIQEVKDQVYFNNYISIYKQIQMPLVIELYDVYYIDIEIHKFAIFELELVDCDLMQLLEGQEQYGQLNDENKMSIAKQLIDAINYLHNFNIINRDIKPIIPYPIIRLKNGSDVYNTNQLVGTMLFSAPENMVEPYDRFVYSKEVNKNITPNQNLNDYLIYSKKSDIFSLGATLCMLDNFKSYNSEEFGKYLTMIKSYFQQPFEKFQINRQSQIYQFIEQFCQYEIDQRIPLFCIVDQNPNDFLSNEQEIKKAKQDCQEFFTLQNEEKQQEEQKSNGQDNTYVLSKKELKDKIERHCKILNPHISKLEQEDINFTHDYFLFYNTVHQDSEKIQLLEQQTEKVINNITEKVKTLDLTKPIQEQKPEDKSSILKGVLFTYFRNEGHQVQLSEGKGSEEDLVSFNQSLSFLTGQLNNSQYYELSIPDTDELTYETITSDENNLKQFIQKFITATSQAYQVPETSIQILNIKKGSVKVHYFIKERLNACVDKIKSMLSETFKNISIALKSLLSNTVIKDSYFDSKFNYYWDEGHQKIRAYRGSLTQIDKKQEQKLYYFPLEYFGFAINVQKIIKDNPQLLQKGPDAWIVLYHGTNLLGYQGITESYIKPGTENFYGDKNFKCRLTGEPIKGGERANTYLSDLATLGKYNATFRDTAEYYSQKKPIEFCGKKYLLMFQCRVNPKYVKSPEKKSHFFTVEAQYAKENIVPYRVLVKQVQY